MDDYELEVSCSGHGLFQAISSIHNQVPCHMALLMALPIPVAKWTKDILTHSLTVTSDTFLRKL